MSDIETIPFTLVQRELCGPYTLLSLQSEEPYDQKPGQYCIVHYQVNNKIITRPYSIASAPNTSGQVELCIQHTGDPETATAIENLRIGSIIEISPAGGRFETPKHDSNAVFIAGGSGITPLLSMIRWRLGKSTKSTKLFYGCKRPNEIPYYEQILALERQFPNFELKVHVDEAADGDKILPGPVTSDLDETIDLQASYFLCGPPPMLDACMDILLKAAVKIDDIHTDRY